MEILQEKINTLTRNQKFLFDGILDVYKNSTLTQQLKLVDRIGLDTFVDGGVVNPITGKRITDQREKNYYWFMENRNLLEEIFCNNIW
jgi:hypothetical protein